MKKLIVYFCSFLIIFNVFTYRPQATLLTQPQPQTYDLGVGALTMGSLLLDGGAVGGAVGAAVIASAPYIVAFATVCIGLGVIYNNREEIQASLVAVYNYAKDKGKNLMDSFSTTADNRVVVSSEAISLVREAYKHYQLDSSALDTIGNIGTFEFDSGTVSNPSIIDVSFPLDGVDDIILKITCSGVGSASAPQGQILIDGNNVGFFDSYFYGNTPRSAYIGLSVGASGWAFKQPTKSIDDLLSKEPSHYGSICADLTINVNQKWGASGSISVDRLLGDSIGNLGNVDSDVIPKNPSISGEKDVAISIPVDRPLTWGDVLEKDWTQTGDITAEDVGSNTDTDTDTGTGEQTGLLGLILGAINSVLDFLKDILGSILGAINSVISFLSSLLSSLINALIDMFVYLFVPSDGLFVDTFNGWKSSLEGKFGLDLGNIDNLQNIGEQGIQDITFTILGISCVLPISIVNKIAPFSRIISTGLISIFLAWYHYRNVIFLLRETAPFSGDGGGRN